MKRIAGFCCAAMFGTLAFAQSGPPVAADIKAVVPPVAPPSADAAAGVGWRSRQGEFYKRHWGIEIVDVRRVASGDMLAFRYVILDPAKAKSINEKKNTAYLIDENTNRKLMVPQLENVGSLRTTPTPVAGRMYWMIFANTGRFVDVGSRVKVVIGDFEAPGLIVDSK